MKIHHTIALVTGANRGLGLAFTRALLARGATKVYAAARNPDSIARAPGIVPIALDVTNADQIAAAAAAAGDVLLLVNNAAIASSSSLLGPDAIAAARAELETNAIGPLATSRAFAPILARNGGGAIVNILSALSWVALPSFATYSASKSAAWSITNGLRHELRGQGTQVIGVHAGFIDTDMASKVAGPKVSPDAVVAAALDAVESGATEVLADAVAQHVKAALSQGVYLEPR